MNDKEWERWADRIDEARKREAVGDLSNIAYQILNSIALTKTALTKAISLSHKEEKKKTNEMIICDHASNGCPEICLHKNPHIHISDYYIEGDFCTNCDAQKSPCGFFDNRFECICK